MKRSDARRMDPDAIITVFERLRQKGQTYIQVQDAIWAVPSLRKRFGEWKEREHLHGEILHDEGHNEDFICVQSKGHTGNCFPNEIEREIVSEINYTDQ